MLLLQRSNMLKTKYALEKLEMRIAADAVVTLVKIPHFVYPPPMPHKDDIIKFTLSNIIGQNFFSLSKAKNLLVTNTTILKSVITVLKRYYLQHLGFISCMKWRKAFVPAYTSEMQGNCETQFTVLRKPHEQRGCLLNCLK